jgi:hypothetical protein
MFATPIPASTSFVAPTLKRKDPPSTIESVAPAPRRKEVAPKPPVAVKRKATTVAAATAESTKKRKVATDALRETVVEYVRLDDRIRSVMDELKDQKKRREKLRVGIMDALKSAGTPACKLDEKNLHLRIKTRKARVKPKKPAVISTMDAWLQARGIAKAGEDLYKMIYENPASFVEKTSLCRIKPRKPRAPKGKVMLLDDGEPTDTSDDDGGSSGSSDESDSGDDASSSDGEN